MAQIPPPYAYVDAYSHKTSYSLQYLLNLQRQFSGNWLVELGYLGSQSHHLQGFQDGNQGTPGTTGSVTSRFPFPTYGVIQLVADGANAVYNSLSAKATRRFSQGVSIISSFTWSKSIDDTSGIRVQGYDTLFPQNSYCIKCERGLSSFDTRARSVTSILYDLPIGKGKLIGTNNSVLNLVAGGWQAGGILTMQKGLPGTLSIGGVDNAGSGAGGYDRPLSTGVSPYVSSPTPSRWLSLGAFTEAPPGQFGNVGRNTIIGPGIFAFDFEVHKQIAMPFNEKHKVQFRLEAFNVLNHPNWTMPNLNVLSGAIQAGQPGTAAHQSFGVITGTNVSMRQIQLGLKYTF